jgi:NitT/TauT family transport system permease protein
LTVSRLAPPPRSGDKLKRSAYAAVGSCNRGQPLKYVGIIALLVLWSLAIKFSGTTLLPTPWGVALGIGELAVKGLLFKYVVASLFRVTWGFVSAAVTAIPLGLALGWFQRGEKALGPLIQLLRPISPLAWIPISILWFGVGDPAAIFIIFVASFLPLVMTASSAVRNVPKVHLQVARNFGLSPTELVRQVILPSILPQLFVGLRITLGIAWLVVVAAEMIAVNSGLGFLIVDARNSGNRYDLVVAGMVLIGIIGLVLDIGARRLEAMFLVRNAASTPGQASLPEAVQST